MRTAGGTGLTFHWPNRRDISLLLPGFIVLSVLLHLLAFYVFQVVYPTSVSILPPPAQGRTVDALESRSSGVAPLDRGGRPRCCFRAFGGHASRPSPAPLSSFVRGSSRDAADRRRDAATDHVSTRKKPARTHQQRRCSQATARCGDSRPAVEGPFLGLAREPRTQNRPADPALRPKARHSFCPRSFLVGVTDRGEVRHIFLQAASGDKTIDQQAEAHLAKIEFAHAPEPMTWGFATYFWGNDASSLQPSTPAPQP